MSPVHWLQAIGTTGALVYIAAHFHYARTTVSFTDAAGLLWVKENDGPPERRLVD